MRKRAFVPGAINHCYQKTVNGELLFYNISDYLVMYTLFCVAARRHKVQVLSLVLMPDHLHHCSVAQDCAELSAFVQDYSSHFASANNLLCNRDSPLFLSPYGSAPKVGDKSARSALVYLGNNGPERKLSSTAETYRWSFLAYYRNSHPFSEPLKLASASQSMRRAVSLVKNRREKGLPMRYQTLQWLFKSLNSKEKQQLVDFIVSQYNVIDYEKAISYFESYDKMLEAMHITKGSEHDIQEEFVGWSDKVYGQMSQILIEQKHLADIHDILTLPEAKKRALLPVLQAKTKATERQVMKFLRLTVADKAVKMK